MSRSAPITIAYPSSSSYMPASPTSGGLYVPVHRRGVSGSYSSSSRASSPTPSSSALSERSISPTPHERHTSLPIYTPADLLLLSSSPLSRLSPEERMTLREVAPVIVRNRKQRKAHEWQSRHKGSSHRRAPSITHSNYTTSESEGEERMGGTWRHVQGLN
ncbi:hypothetical protein BV22DRAFT_1117434 [Leucogyrophana mollusca]|uniref:Uncharacterized protein n=1 Tax=Leucogyrophana mollusca TaxID=85980 RepID=A0ACB8BUN9_9AGAM|nr:hypothetical protein BV22DRAFT_1117434 [Leucogyrophana mollusca]